MWAIKWVDVRRTLVYRELSDRVPEQVKGYTMHTTNSDQTDRLSQAILRRTITNIVLFTVIYVGVFFLLASTVLNFLSDLVYTIVFESNTLHSMIASLFMIAVVVGYVMGIVFIVRSGIRRALSYFDKLLASVEGILTKREDPIILPSELMPTTLALNAIKTASEQNERAAKAAEDRKNELVVYLAHDIKTPLTSIIGYLTLMDESPDLPVDTRARYTRITLEKSYRLEELLDEFFEITRYNLQAIPIERSWFDGALFCAQILEEFYPLAEGRSLSLVYDGPAKLSVFADAGRVARVLNNVLKNAVAYADAHTDVRIHTGLVTAADGFVWWELTVTDQGQELSPQHLERIFEKFFRADAARGTHAGGAGLGLAVAREIARAHGGDIYARSDAGLTSFTIWIPQGPCVQQ